jgi:hypothetical protein
MRQARQRSPLGGVFRDRGRPESYLFRPGCRPTSKLRPHPPQGLDPFPDCVFRQFDHGNLPAKAGPNHSSWTLRMSPIDLTTKGLNPMKKKHLDSLHFSDRRHKSFGVLDWY